MQNTNTSFSILVPFSTINKKSNRNLTNTMQKSLSSIIAENEIREENLEYQHVLIRRKELEIQMEERRNEYELLVKRRKKAERGFEQAIAKRDQVLLECKEKRCYLQRYYEELDRKFKGGKEELFNNLAKLQQSLLDAYEKDEKRLRDSLVSQEEEFNRLVSLVGVENQRRNHLRQELNKLQIAADGESFGLRKQGENSCNDLRNENNYYRQEIERFGREKKLLQNEQRILKKILNVEEEHRKHSTIIQNGIRKMFLIKLKEQRYKVAVSTDYEKNIQRLREIIAEKRIEKNHFQQEITDKKALLEGIIRGNNEKNREYGELEEKLIRRLSNY